MVLWVVSFYVEIKTECLVLARPKLLVWCLRKNWVGFVSFKSKYKETTFSCNLLLRSYLVCSTNVKVHFVHLICLLIYWRECLRKYSCEDWPRSLRKIPICFYAESLNGNMNIAHSTGLLKVRSLNVFKAMILGTPSQVVMTFCTVCTGRHWKKLYPVSLHPCFGQAFWYL